MVRCSHSAVWETRKGEVVKLSCYLFSYRSPIQQSYLSELSNFVTNTETEKAMLTKNGVHLLTNSALEVLNFVTSAVCHQHLFSRASLHLSCQTLVTITCVRVTYVRQTCVRVTCFKEGQLYPFPFLYSRCMLMLTFCETCCFCVLWVNSPQNALIVIVVVTIMTEQSKLKGLASNFDKDPILIRGSRKGS